MAETQLERKRIRIAFLATDGVEQVELTDPWKAAPREGGEPDLARSGRASEQEADR